MKKKKGCLYYIGIVFVALTFIGMIGNLVDPVEEEVEKDVIVEDSVEVENVEVEEVNIPEESIKTFDLTKEEFKKIFNKNSDNLKTGIKINKMIQKESYVEIKLYDYMYIGLIEKEGKICCVNLLVDNNFTENESTKILLAYANVIWTLNNDLDLEEKRGLVDSVSKKMFENEFNYSMKISDKTYTSVLSEETGLFFEVNAN